MGIYLVNSVNPFRLEGQKTIMFRVLEALRWEVPDWIVVPGGNLGNSSAFGKAFIELNEIGLIDRDAAAGRDQCRRRQHAVRAVTNAAACAGTAAGRTDEIVDGYYAELDATHRRPRRSPAPSKSIGR